MKIVIYILGLFILVLIGQTSEYRYEEIFQNSYFQAIDFIDQNKEIFKQELGEDQALFYEKVAIVFPELLKYSMFKDIIETTALELIYVNYGKDQADFSVGYFQMKPSFIEDMEQEIIMNKELSAKYVNLITYKDTVIKEIRKERILRLQSIKWQLRYLSCFYEYISMKYSDLELEGGETKIRYYSTAYNHNFKASKKDIELWMYQKVFPFGLNKGKQQYAYSDIAVYYYKNMLD